MLHQLAFSTPAEEALEAPGPRAELALEHTVAFMLAGRAHVTFQSRRTETRFTYRVRAGEKPGRHLVYVLTGPDYYEYLGCIYDRRAYSHGHRSRIARTALSSVAFMWVWSKLVAGKPHAELAVYHEGRCGACGRRLTTPESVSLGLGPTCAGKAGL